MAKKQSKALCCVRGACAVTAGGGACDPTCDAACGEDSIAMAANNIGKMFRIMAWTSRQIESPNYTTADSSMRSVPASASSSTSTPTGKVNCVLI